MTMTMTVDEVRQHAEVMELKAVNFLDSNGAIGARGLEVATVHLIFIDGKEAKLTVDEFARLQDVSFRLRPTLNNS